MLSILQLTGILSSALHNAHSKGLLNKPYRYYNEILGDAPQAIGGLLQGLLLSQSSEYKQSGKWIDGCLIEKLEYNTEQIKIWGVTISGEGGSDKDMLTDPFYLEVTLNEHNDTFNTIRILFADADREHVPYSDTRFREAWNKEFYSNSDWDVSERNWLYEVEATV